MQDEGDKPLWGHFNRLSPKLEFRFNGAMECVVGRLNMKCTDGRMMANLLTHNSVTKNLTSVKMIGFTKQRVEWLSNTIPVRCSRRHSKRCHQLAHKDTWSQYDQNEWGVSAYQSKRGHNAIMVQIVTDEMNIKYV